MPTAFIDIPDLHVGLREWGRWVRSEILSYALSKVLTTDAKLYTLKLIVMQAKGRRTAWRGTRHVRHRTSEAHIPHRRQTKEQRTRSFFSKSHPNMRQRVSGTLNAGCIVPAWCKCVWS